MAVLAQLLSLSLLLLSVTAADDTCTFYNQDTTNVVVKLNDQTVTTDDEPTNAQTFTINVGQSITISCKDPASNSFQYNEQTVYSCDTASDTSEHLPLCTGWCTKTKTLMDAHTSFQLADGTDVSGSKLASGTPVTVSCSGVYAQKYAQNANQLCDDSLTSEATCKEMCELGSYDSSTTTVDGEGLKTVGTTKYLKLGYDVDISCTKSEYALPVDAEVKPKCETAGTDLTITSCLKKCSVDSLVKPDGTEYTSSQNSLLPGESFSITCSDPTMELPLGSKDSVTCGDDGQFPTPIPSCKATCVVPTVTGTTALNTTKQRLAQNEALEVTCTDHPAESLPWPYDYPLIQKCGSDATITVPSCQKTCSKPDDPDHATVTSTATTYSNLEPVSVRCDTNYVYSDSTSTVKEFLCQYGSTSGDASVTIDEFCYIQAKVRTKQVGSEAVQVQGNIDLASDLLSDVSVDISVTGPNSYSDDKTGLSVNDFVTFNATYQPLQVTISTSRTGQSTTVTYTEENIYPGPPAPVIKQTFSSSEQVSFDFIHQSNDYLTTALENGSPSYFLSYELNGKTQTDTTTSATNVPIYGLTDSSTYDITVKLTLSDEYGGFSTETTYSVQTGPAGVADSDVTWTLEGDTVTIEWSAVTGASTYTLSLVQDGTAIHGPTTTSHTYWTVNLGALTTEQQFNVSILASRTVDSTSFAGDTSLLTGYRAGVQAPVGMVTATNVSDTVVITRVTTTIKRSATEKKAYIVFVQRTGGSTEKHTLTKTMDELVVKNLEESSSYQVSVAEAVGDSGHGAKLVLATFTTADCPGMTCINCERQDYFNFVQHGQEVVVLCDSPNATIEDTETKEKLKELQLTCINHQYVYSDKTSRIYVSSVIECTNADAVIDPDDGGEKDYLIFYIIGGIALFVILLILIVLILVRRRRTQGSYDAKKVKETNIGDVTPRPGSEAPSRGIAYDNNYFENKWDRELATTRATSARSKATSYGSQELRMEIADSDSGITEDLDHTFRNPVIFNSEFDDTVSTKSALV